MISWQNSGIFVEPYTKGLEIKHVRKCEWSFTKWWLASCQWVMDSFRIRWEKDTAIEVRFLMGTLD